MARLPLGVRVFPAGDASGRVIVPSLRKLNLPCEQR